MRITIKRYPILLLLVVAISLFIYARFLTPVITPDTTTLSWFNTQKIIKACQVKSATYLPSTCIPGANRAGGPASLDITLQNNQKISVTGLASGDQNAQNDPVLIFFQEANSICGDIPLKKLWLIDCIGE